MMVMDKEVPVSLLGTQEDSDSNSVIIDSTTEGKGDDKLSQNGEQQVMAQTIVFSFLKRKENFGKLSNFIVPGIGLCEESFIFYMYDCVEDVLLGTLPFNIFADCGPSVLDIQAVVVLWLLLNYNIFGNCVPDNLKQYKSEFCWKTGEKFLDMYMNKVKQPCHVKPLEKNVMMPNWSKLVCYSKASEYFPSYLTDRESISLSKYFSAGD